MAGRAQPSWIQAHQLGIGEVLVLLRLSDEELGTREPRWFVQLRRFCLGERPDTRDRNRKVLAVP